MPKKKSVCKQCKKSFSYNTLCSSGAFCSKECWKKYLKSKYKKKNCLQCDKEFSVKPSSKQKFCSYECASDYLRGGNHHAYNKEERKRVCEYCGEEFYVDFVKSKIRYCGRECMGMANSKEEHWNWIDGAYDIYPNIFTPTLKAKIRDRDNHVCQMCEIDESELTTLLSIHHIDYDKRNCAEDNLISLCNRCHMKTNYNREMYKKILQKMLGVMNETD